VARTNAPEHALVRRVLEYMCAMQCRILVQMCKMFREEQFDKFCQNVPRGTILIHISVAKDSSL
jgi:hypothetical protein